MLEWLRPKNSHLLGLSPIFRTSLVTAVWVNSHSPVADEGLAPPHIGSYIVVHGWLRFSEILGKNYYFIFFVFVVLFSIRSCLFFNQSINIIDLCCSQMLIRPSACRCKAGASACSRVSLG